MGLSSGSRSGLRGDLAHSSHFASAEAEAGRSRNRPRGTRPASTLGGFPFSTVVLLLLTRSDPGGRCQEERQVQCHSRDLPQREPFVRGPSPCISEKSV